MEHQPETNTVIESSNGIIDSPQPIKPSRFVNIPTSDPVQTHGLVSNYINSMPFENLPTQVIFIIRDALDCQDSISALRRINGRTYSVLEKTLYKQNVSNHESSAYYKHASMEKRSPDVKLLVLGADIRTSPRPPTLPEDVESQLQELTINECDDEDECVSIFLWDFAHFLTPTISTSPPVPPFQQPYGLGTFGLVKLLKNISIFRGIVAESSDTQPRLTSLNCAHVADFSR
ncbi:unnamed protein product [Penicillium viridicatum]